MKYYCIRHQENLCAKTLEKDNVMQIVIKAMNFVKCKGVNNCQLEEFLKSVGDDYGVIIHFFLKKGG